MWQGSKNWESGLSLIGTNHHFDQSSLSGSELSLQPQKVPDAVFAVKLRLGAIFIRTLDISFT